MDSTFPSAPTATVDGYSSLTLALRRLESEIQSSLEGLPDGDETASRLNDAFESVKKRFGQINALDKQIDNLASIRTCFKPNMSFDELPDLKQKMVRKQLAMSLAKYMHDNAAQPEPWLTAEDLVRDGIPTAVASEAFACQESITRERKSRKQRWLSALTDLQRCVPDIVI